ncbi:hypothetical protein SD71_05200 [Cohnella kolymensis]|uniref:Nucleotidyltransferase-like domain-containing protein n=2 Tax=Cohnella kolymensis TaxID=1590652 RepID=A0ABR5A736_9BACL|nr:hypothetical protein SD71_05200 [Cohnella kolymensis]
MDIGWLKAEQGLVGLLVMSNPFSYRPFNDGIDLLAVVVMKKVSADKQTEHLLKDDSRIQLHRVTPDTLERWIVSGENRKIVQWLLEGDILIDDTGYLENLRSRLIEWSPLLREQRLLCEFSRFVGTYSRARQDLKDGQALDAYSHVMASLHYWADIALVEQGLHPELTVWEQMRRVNPGLYKLFEELTTSSETLEQRVELVLLACEFSLLTKMESCCSLLIRIIESREQFWSVAELRQHPELSGLSLDLPLLLQKLVKRGCIREVARSARDRGEGLMELCYTSMKQL